MALDTTACATALAKQYQQDVMVDDANMLGDFAKSFASIYNAYAIGGTVEGAINTGGNPELLEAAFKNNPSITTLATAFANFWAKVALQPDNRCDCEDCEDCEENITITAVSNDAASRITDFENAIRNSIAKKPSQPWFYNLIDSIETDAIANIQWAVTKTVAGVVSISKETLS